MSIRRDCAACSGFRRTMVGGHRHCHDVVGAAISSLFCGMTAAILRLRTPTPFLASHERVRGTVASPSYALVGIGEHDRIELPRSVHQALTKVVAALHAGKAVTIAPQTMKLTPQRAADLLGVSRPTVVRLITDGTLPADRIGNRHRLLLDCQWPRGSIRWWPDKSTHPVR